jgi:hypothetical protein
VASGGADDPNKRNHIFANPTHNLDALVRHYGGEEEAFRAIVDAINQALQAGKLSTHRSGVYPQVFDVGGYSVMGTDRQWLRAHRNRLDSAPSMGLGGPASGGHAPLEAARRRSFCRLLGMGVTMPNLSPTEQRIIRWMLVEKFGTTSPPISEIPALKFETRHTTGTGYYVNFSNPHVLPPIDELNTELSEDLRTTLPAPCDVVGSTLFIRNGYLTSFECYTFGHVDWPDEQMEDWLIFDAA